MSSGADLLAVQDLDVRLDQLRHRHAHHPLTDELAAVDDRLAALDTQRADIERRAAATEARRAEIDREVVAIRSKRAEVEAKLYDGSVTATKDLLALQEESSMLLDRRNAHEDAELEVMEEAEQVSAELAEADARRAEIVTERDGVVARLADARAEIDAEIATVSEQRAQVAGAVSADALARYEELRPPFDGVPLARLLEGRRCEGCHLTLSAVDVDRIGKQPSDADVRCPECGRLLIR